MKYVLLIGLVLCCLWFFRRQAGGRSRVKASARGSERMVECARCGVYLPESESLREGGLPYCCAEHRSAARDRAE